jgi:hypothetical protein
MDVTPVDRDEGQLKGESRVVVETQRAFQSKPSKTDQGLNRDTGAV